MASNLVKLAKESDKATRALALARKALAKVKAQKRPRTKTLEVSKAAVEKAKAKCDAVAAEIAAVMNGATPREPNPAPPADGGGDPQQPQPAPDDSSSGAIGRAAAQMIVDATKTYLASLEEALDLFERTPNPHVRGYTRSSHVRPHERGASRFFGQSTGYQERGR